MTTENVPEKKVLKLSLDKTERCEVDIDLPVGVDELTDEFLQAAVKDALALRPGFSVNGYELRLQEVADPAEYEILQTEDWIGICESCERNIFEDEQYTPSEDGVKLCLGCSTETEAEGAQET